MAKDPAFLFYPNDYIGGTMGMDFEQKGAYIELLMLQFNRGHMSEHMILHVLLYNSDLWGAIKDKFKIDKENKYYNERLELEKEKRAKYSLSRRNNRNSTKDKPIVNPHKKDMSEHMLPHMENEDVNEDDNKGNSKKKENNNKEVFDYKNIHKKIPDDVYEHYTNAQVKERTVLLANEMVQSDEWMVSVARLMNRTPEIALKKVKEFLRLIEVSRECFDTLSGVKKHFSRWIKYNLNE